MSRRHADVGASESRRRTPMDGARPADSYADQAPYYADVERTCGSAAVIPTGTQHRRAEGAAREVRRDWAAREPREERPEGRASGAVTSGGSAGGADGALGDGQPRAFSFASISSLPESSSPVSAHSRYACRCSRVVSSVTSSCSSGPDRRLAASYNAATSEGSGSVITTLFWQAEAEEVHPGYRAGRAAAGQPRVKSQT